MYNAECPVCHVVTDHTSDTYGYYCCNACGAFHVYADLAPAVPEEEANDDVPSEEPRASPHPTPTRYQQRVSRYLLASLNFYSDRLALQEVGLIKLVRPIPWLLGSAAVALLLLLVLSLVLGLLANVVGQWIEYALYLVPLLTLLIAYLNQPDTNAGWVGLRTLNEQPAFSIGHFERYSDPRVPYLYSSTLGVLFGFHLGLYWLTPNHCGLPIAGGFVQSFWLTLDAVSQGVLLSASELYGFGLSEPVEETYFAMALSWAFRLGYATFIVLLSLHNWRRGSLENALAQWPGPEPSNHEVAFWTEEVIGTWEDARTFFDESMFLTLAGLYLHGNYAHAGVLARQFPWLRLRPEARELFIDAEGQALFDTATAT